MHADVLAHDLPVLHPLERQRIAAAISMAWVESEQYMQRQEAQAADVRQEKEAAQHLLVAAVLRMVD
jgi:hypothetical protein